MTRKTFLSLSSSTALAVGLFALLAPGVLLGSVKMAVPSEAANVMARTVGVLLLFTGGLGLAVRGHPDSPTMRVILGANLALQIMILPIDPMAYANGVFSTWGSFLPNTILHIFLASGFAYYLWRSTPRTS
ncbi:MAG: hypothetical protein U1E65_16095 [Myxococcota bacterium]